MTPAESLRTAIAAVLVGLLLLLTVLAMPWIVAVAVGVMP